MINKVLVIGLDCFEPSLVFDRWRDRLPNLAGLKESGTFGTLESSMPPITVPAWSCMSSGLDPGSLGIYGFRNRADHSYDKLSIATSLAVKAPRLWDRLTQANKQSIVVGVPGTFPATKQLNGVMVSCFLTPDTTDMTSPWTTPPNLKDEITQVVGEYMVDVKGFRTDDKQWLLDQIYEMTRRRFALVRHFVSSRPWDLCWMVEMGTDRIHHGFWSHMDPDHPKYTPGHPLEHAIRDYYEYIDIEIGKLLEVIPRDETAIWVVSDHGAKAMHGGILFNQWLHNEGYLQLNEPLKGRTKWDPAMADWSRTKAWGDGGYYGRLFINKEGREPNGQVRAADYEALRRELTAKIEAMVDHQGKPLGNKCYRPEDIYTNVEGVAPDLVVIFGDLKWRSVGWLGSDTIYTFENDTGPDDANHAQLGMYIVSHPSLPAKGRCDGPHLYDMAPTLMKQLGLSVPGHLRGRDIVQTFLS